MGMVWRKSTVLWEKHFNPSTPKSDQFQCSPAASPETLHHTVWRTLLFMAWSDKRSLYYQFSLPHLHMFSLKVGSERVAGQNWGLCPFHCAVPATNILTWILDVLQFVPRLLREYPGAWGRTEERLKFSLPLIHLSLLIFPSETPSSMARHRG